MKTLIAFLLAVPRAVPLLLLSFPAFGATYYVDFTNGLDANNGTSKSTPWKDAPGMNVCASACASATINAGDSVILKGCVTWPNSVLPWAWSFNGASGNNIYVGVDQTWWDNTVSGCSTTWNRPILNGGGLTTNRGNGAENIVTLRPNYVTFDNFEITGALANPTPTLVNNATTIISLLGGDVGSINVIVSNCYIHGWVNPYFCYGTGNVAANSSTITNFVPTYCSQPFGSNWALFYSTYYYMPVQIAPQGSYWPVQSGAPVVTGVTGSNPYTITTNSSTVASACNSCNVMMGMNIQSIIAGNDSGNPGATVENCVIDGSDTAEVQINPYPDCGLSEGNNNMCLASGGAGFRGPQIWLNNVIRYTSNGLIVSDGYFGGNLIEYVGGRQGLDPTGHSNIVEATDSNAGLNWIFWNNLVRHTNNPNPNNPLGRTTVGLSIEPDASSGLASYTFNNVITDTIANAMFEPVSGSGYGVAYLFNNTADCGPSWSLTYSCASAITQGGVSENNNFITTASPYVASSFTKSNDVVWTPTQATSAGFTTGETYIYSPPNSTCTGVTPCTVGEGLNLQALCTTIAAIYAPAGSACQSTTVYGATYNTTNHTAVTAARAVVLRPSSAAWDAGAYEFQATGPPGKICYRCVLVNPR